MTRNTTTPNANLIVRACGDLLQGIRETVNLFLVALVGLL